MIESMTGYGKATAQLSSKKVVVEIKSLNSKGLDLNLRLPLLLKELEMPLRRIISEELSRGKVDCYISLEDTHELMPAHINQAVVQGYMEQLQGIAPNASQSELLQMAIRLPDAFFQASEELSPTDATAVEQAVREALAALQAFRKAEGEALKHDFVARIEQITQLLYQVEKHDEVRLEQIRQRLDKAVADIRQRIDENRFEQELIFYLEKLDITEEKVRLSNHLNYFLANLHVAQSGKVLGFIAQEIGREINTMGSKASYAPMQQTVVLMKNELEKIKEQSLNIL